MQVAVGPQATQTTIPATGVAQAVAVQGPAVRVAMPQELMRAQAPRMVAAMVAQARLAAATGTQATQLAAAAAVPAPKAIPLAAAVRVRQDRSLSPTLPRP